MRQSLQCIRVEQHHPESGQPPTHNNGFAIAAIDKGGALARQAVACLPTANFQILAKRSSGQMSVRLAAIPVHRSIGIGSKERVRVQQALNRSRNKFRTPFDWFCRGAFDWTRCSDLSVGIFPETKSAQCQ